MTNHPCCKLPLKKVYFVGATTKSGKKVQLQVDESTYETIQQYTKHDPNAKLIVEDIHE